MKVSAKPKPQARRRVSPQKPSHRGQEIVGVVLIAIGLVAFLSLLLSNTGILGEVAGGFCRALAGRAAWVLPAILIGLGGAYIAGRKSIGLPHLSWGLTLLFLSISGFMARSVGGDFFDYSAVSSSGGYVGAVVGWLFASLLGEAKAVGLGAVAMVGLILCLDTPIRSLLESARDRAAALTARRPRPRLEASKKAVVEIADRPIDRLATRSLETVEAKVERTKPIVRELDQTTPELRTSVGKEGYILPGLDLLSPPVEHAKRSPQEMQRNIETLEGTLEQFGIEANVVEVATGPTVTRYEIQLGPGIRVARIVALADNIAMDLAASQVRVEAPIPGKAAIGVEVPNSKPSPVNLREVIDSKEFWEHPSRLAIALGQDVSGANKYADLTRMPHLLIGGATNSGKSIGLAALITSLLMRNTPKDVRLVMIDPKRVELTFFDGIPHLMCPVIKDIKEAPGVLRAVWREMDRRYSQLSEHGVRNIDGWNAQASFQDKMPYIVVVIDELADLMIAAKAEVETTIVRLAQLARAVGIHLVIATQRPSVDVITGTIKANIPSRIAFAVSSQIDSRTILDEKGADDLIGRGDMLFKPIDANKPIRVQGCYVAEREIESICNFWRAQETPVYSITPEEESGEERGHGDFSDTGDALWEDAVRWVVERGQASTSMMQRRFSIGFQRASRLLDMMEERGIVGPRDGPRPREVLVGLSDLDSLFGLAPQYDTGWIDDEEAV